MQLIGNHRVFGEYTIGPSFGYVLCILCVCLIVGYWVISSLGIFGRIVFGISFSLEIFLLLKTSLTEPGIIPRSTNVSGGSTDNIEQIVNGTLFVRKWCHTCNIYRPPRGKHCGLCNCCIDKFDHHCTFLSTCIGVRNHRWFIILLIHTILLAAAVLVFGGGDGWIRIVVIALSVTIILLVGNMLYFHIRLIFKGTTSYEESKRAVSESTEYPYSLGGWRINFFSFWNAPIENCRFDARQRIIGRPTSEEMTVLNPKVTQETQ